MSLDTHYLVFKDLRQFIILGQKLKLVKHLNFSALINKSGA